MQWRCVCAAGALMHTTVRSHACSDSAVVCWPLHRIRLALCYTLAARTPKLYLAGCCEREHAHNTHTIRPNRHTQIPRMGARVPAYTRVTWHTYTHATCQETATGPKGAYGLAALMKAVTAAGLPHPGQLLHIPVAGIHPRAHTLSIERPFNTSRCKYDRRYGVRTHVEISCPCV